jgi:molybdate transport system regulatory protein
MISETLPAGTCLHCFAIIFIIGDYDIHPAPGPKRTMKNNAMTLFAADKGRCLDSLQLERLEQAFASWAHEPRRAATKVSRMRIYMIFLIIRHAGGKLSEVLAIDPAKDLDFKKRIVHFGHSKRTASSREVPVPESLCQKIRSMVNDPDLKAFISKWGFSVDPGFVRRKFYEQADACNIDRKLASPESIRRARAVELLVNGMPLPVAQALLGHSNPGLAASQVVFSGDDIHEVMRIFMEKESFRKTSARNSFFGKISHIVKGDIQSMVELQTMSSGPITTIITNDSLSRLGLVEGKIITAEIKAPWVILHKTDTEPRCSAENRFQGVVRRIHQGEINTEYVLRISDDTELCAIVNTGPARTLGIREQDTVWAVFSSYAVVLHLD